MNPPEELKIRFRDLETLLYLAGCGVNDGAGSDGDIEKVQRRLERMNAPYHEFRKEKRMRRHAETQKARKEVKKFAREHRGELWWWEASIEDFWVKVRVTGSEDTQVKVESLGEIVFSEEVNRVFGYTWIHSNYSKGKDFLTSIARLKSIVSQLGTPKPQRPKSVYEPGRGTRRSGGSLGT